MKYITISVIAIVLGFVVALGCVMIAKSQKPIEPETSTETTSVPKEIIHLGTTDVEKIKENAYKVIYDKESNISVYYVEGDFRELDFEGTYIYIEYPEGVNSSWQATPLNVRYVDTEDGLVLDMDALKEGIQALDDMLEKLFSLEGATYGTWKKFYRDGGIAEINRMMTAEELIEAFSLRNERMVGWVTNNIFIDGHIYCVSIKPEDEYVINVCINYLPILTEGDIVDADTVIVETEILTPIS